MKEPRRLLDDPAHGPFLHSVLEAGVDLGPPPGAKDALLRSLEIALAAGAVATTAHVASGSASALASTAPSATASAGKVAALKLGLAKIIGIATLSTVVVGGAALAAKLLPRATENASDHAAQTAGATETASLEMPAASELTAPARAVSTETIVAARSDAPLSPSKSAPVVADHAGAPRAEAQVALAAPPHESAATPREDDAKENRLVAESEAFAGARAKMRSGDATGAVRALDDMQKRFGAGGLSQERAALYVEALAASGHADQARSFADAFIAAHPSSTLAERMKPYATPRPE